MKKFVKFIIYAIVALVVFGFVMAMLGDDKPKADTAKVETTTEAKADEAKAEEVKADEPKLTTSQKNAVRSAENYLAFKGFSRDGLIDQLSSEYGDKYDKQDATVAVDSLDVDWNEQAAKSAQSYLDLKGFSCQGLVEQLSSKHGDKFTKEQAQYGAKAAGVCD